jgi:hypothetical protein
MCCARRSLHACVQKRELTGMPALRRLLYDVMLAVVVSTFPLPQYKARYSREKAQTNFCCADQKGHHTRMMKL